MAALCGVKHAVAVSSGTAALHLIVRGLGLEAGDEAQLRTPAGERHFEIVEIG